MCQALSLGFGDTIYLPKEASPHEPPQLHPPLPAGFLLARPAAIVFHVPKQPPSSGTWEKHDELLTEAATPAATNEGQTVVECGWQRNALVLHFGLTQSPKWTIVGVPKA